MRPTTELETSIDRQTLLMLSLSSVISDGVRAVYQPVVHLDSTEAVGFEALARGPRGSLLESPAAPFQMAREEQAMGVLDWACRAAAIRGALQSGMRGSAV